MKLLLYCTKGQPDIMKVEYVAGPDNYCKLKETHLNGKIVAECDYEIKELKYSEELLKKSCLTAKELFEYIKKSNTAYEIHIKNLHEFDEPRELSHYWSKDFNEIKKAPQNMMEVIEDVEGGFGDHYILISIRSKWLCKITSREKTIEIRKKVLKVMLK